MKHYFFFLTFVAALSSCHTPGKKFTGAIANDNIGQPFTLSNIVDTSGKQVSLDFSGSEITIIDFWNNGCPPCIAEMKQFTDLIKGKESKVTIYSISFTQFWLWKPTLQEHTGAFSFLQYELPNWKQYNLLTEDNPRFKNSISIDRWSELTTRYNMVTNPAYFVIDQSGKIIARPESAVEYLKQML